MQSLGVLSLVSEARGVRMLMRAMRLFQPVLAGFGRALEAIRFPNAVLASLVIAPTLVFGFSLSERTLGVRESALIGIDRASVAVGFGVETVTIDGLRDTRERDVLDYLAVSEETSLLRFDLESARDRVLALPWVAGASVRRVLPHTLYVELVEHEPFARLLQSGRIRLVTVAGEEITDEIVSPHSELPLVVGEGAPRYVEAIFAELASRASVLSSVQALELVAERRWTLHMAGGIQVLLPETETAEALDKLDVMMREHAILDREVAAIDFRRDDQLVIKLTDQAVELLGAVNQEDGA